MAATSTGWSGLESICPLQQFYWAHTLQFHRPEGLKSFWRQQRNQRNFKETSNKTRFYRFHCRFFLVPFSCSKSIRDKNTTMEILAPCPYISFSVWRMGREDVGTTKLCWTHLGLLLSCGVRRGVSQCESVWVYISVTIRNNYRIFECHSQAAWGPFWRYLAFSSTTVTWIQAATL